MGFVRGFIEFARVDMPHVPVEERVKSFCEIYGTLPDDKAKIQAGRCMDCGIPFCMHECPLHNDMPDFNDFVCEGEYKKAYTVLSSTNNFPEITGRICPALCEEGCTLGIHRDPVGIKSVERKIAEYAFEHGYVRAQTISERSGKKVAVVGSGPAALAAAQQLNRYGHDVVVFEKMNKIGGLLRYGIPDYRLPHDVLERDIEHILTTGINVITDVSIGKDVSMEDIQKSFDAVYISIGAHNDKKLGIEGEDAINVVSAVGLLRRIGEGDAPDFTGKKICVIGGGNVSMDATRTAKRLGAESVTCVYRRRVDDMTALAEEIEEAMAEGCQILPLQAPARIEKDAEGKVAALWTTPQIIGPYGKDGRPKPISADVPEFRILH